MTEVKCIVPSLTSFYCICGQQLGVINKRTVGDWLYSLVFVHSLFNLTCFRTLSLLKKDAACSPTN